ncbi:hypothetical protein M422DRAFT_257269 [Sphaerobolus stellatus SS14]|uniref:Sde2 N-terminal ubiquitin domain-containing protein n=1 Tax=Sphaerobolus stellatus (strain SS14) TaxID=990650 RepID=A0A0C9VF10_SPHS4|nr:hypothetical protein M422DRAFT_257269 [Sphaerobolus stellatus SS14]
MTSFPPVPTVTLYLPSETPLHAIPSLVAEKYPSFSDSEDIYVSSQPPLSSGPLPDISTTPVELKADHVSVRVIPKLRSGKGGFGSQSQHQRLVVPTDSIRRRPDSEAH